jgi:hydrogen peroxide-dependent heme synthase
MSGPVVPATLDGWSLLHQMFSMNWAAWRAEAPDMRAAVAEEAAVCLESLDKASGPGATRLVAILGHKADLMLLHSRRSFDALAAAELMVARTRLAAYLAPSSSYVSVVELGMYEMTAKMHEQLTARGIQGGSDAFEEAVAEEMTRQAQRVESRLFPEIPRKRYVCFYPMNKRRGEVKNWYGAAFTRRAAMMREHGLIGRKYAGQVIQLISGSIGFDDWEWGVDLFADDPLVFKRLIYEMRFDEVSADYAEFGPFYVGLQFSSAGLAAYLDGQVPAL